MLGGCYACLPSRLWFRRWAHLLIRSYVAAGNSGAGAGSLSSAGSRRGSGRKWRHGGECDRYHHQRCHWYCGHRAQRRARTVFLYRFAPRRLHGEGASFRLSHLRKEECSSAGRPADQRGFRAASAEREREYRSHADGADDGHRECDSGHGHQQRVCARTPSSQPQLLWPDVPGRGRDRGGRVRHR